LASATSSFVKHPIWRLCRRSGSIVRSCRHQREPACFFPPSFIRNCGFRGITPPAGRGAKPRVYLIFRRSKEAFLYRFMSVSSTTSPLSR
jgi:hypothetical protein